MFLAYAPVLLLSFLASASTVGACTSDLQCGIGGCCHSGSCRPCNYPAAASQLLVSYILFALGGVICVADVALCVCLWRRRRNGSAVTPPAKKEITV